MDSKQNGNGRHINHKKNQEQLKEEENIKWIGKKW